MNEIDSRCFCKECEARERGTYRLVVHCTNCGEDSVALMRKGDTFNEWRGCPVCGVSHRWITGGLYRPAGAAPEDRT